MNTQFTSILRTFVSVLFGWLSDPQHTRLLVAMVVLCLILAALLFPVMSVGAGGIPGGVGH